MSNSPKETSVSRVAKGVDGGPRIIADPTLDGGCTVALPHTQLRVRTLDELLDDVGDDWPRATRPATKSVSTPGRVPMAPAIVHPPRQQPITHSVLDASGQRLSFTRAIERVDPAPAVRSKHTQLLAKNTLPLPVNDEEQSAYDRTSERAIAACDEDIDEVTPDALRRLEQFARHFKLRRIKLGFTQYDVSSAMAHYYSQEFSQTTISRFEAMNLSFNNMVKLKPMLENWLIETERRIVDGTYAPLSANPTDQGGQGIQTLADHHNIMVPQRKRRKRTPIDGHIRKMLEDSYHVNARPTPEAIDKREVVRIWFCNRRQRDRRRAQMLLMRRQHGKMDAADLEELAQLHRESFTGDDQEAREDAEVSEGEGDETKHARRDPPSLAVQVERKAIVEAAPNRDPFDHEEEEATDEDERNPIPRDLPSTSKHVRSLMAARSMPVHDDYDIESVMPYRPPRAPEVVVGPDGLQRLRLVASGQAFTVASPAPVYASRGGQYANVADVTIEEEEVYDEQGGVLYEQIVDEVTGNVIYTPITTVEATALEPDPLAETPASEESIDRVATPTAPIDHMQLPVEMDRQQGLSVEDFFAPEEHDVEEARE